MRYLPLIFFFSFISNSYSQQTNHFKEIVQDLDIKESFTDTLYFASGIIKSIKTTSIYNYNNVEYVALTGKSIENYRNGKIEFEDWYDNFGNNLKGKVFDKKGNLLSEMIATEINTEAENLDQFFESVSEMDYPNALISFKRLIKIYTYSKKSEK